MAGQGHRGKDRGRAQEDAVSEVALEVAGEVAEAKGGLRASKEDAVIIKGVFDQVVVHDSGERADLRGRVAMVGVVQRSG